MKTVEQSMDLLSKAMVNFPEIIAKNYQINGNDSLL